MITYPKVRLYASGHLNYDGTTQRARRWTVTRNGKAVGRIEKQGLFWLALPDKPFGAPSITSEHGCAEHAMLAVSTYATIQLR